MGLTDLPRLEYEIPQGRSSSYAASLTASNITCTGDLIPLLELIAMLLKTPEIRLHIEDADLDTKTWQHGMHL